MATPRLGTGALCCAIIAVSKIFLCESLSDAKFGLRQEPLNELSDLPSFSSNATAFIAFSPNTTLIQNEIHKLSGLPETIDDGITLKNDQNHYRTIYESIYSFHGFIQSNLQSLLGGKSQSVLQSLFEWSVGRKTVTVIVFSFTLGLVAVAKALYEQVACRKHMLDTELRTSLTAWKRKKGNKASNAPEDSNKGDVSSKCHALGSQTDVESENITAILCAEEEAGKVPADKSSQSTLLPDKICDDDENDEHEEEYEAEYSSADEAETLLNPEDADEQIHHPCDHHQLHE
eukprot:jgi/Bigna1/137583/aug1.40_g12291